MEFIYKARNQKGEVVSDKVNAIDREAAVKILQDHNLIPLSIEQRKTQSSLMLELQRLTESVDQRELSVVFQQLSILIDAKVPIMQSLSTIEQQVENRYLKSVMRDVRLNVEDGMTLSESFGKYPQAFSPLIINMTRAGEVSGNLQKSIGYISENIEKTYKLNARIKNAMYYPMIVLAVAAVVTFLVFTIVLPKLTGMIKELKVEVPWYSRLLMDIGAFMAVYWWAVLVVIVGGLVGFIYYIKTEAGKKEWDIVKLKIPVVKVLIRDVYMARFADNLSLLLMGGIPIVRALLIVGDVVNYSVYKSVILRSADEVRSGGNISTVLAKSADVPPLVTRMVKVGEETGKVGEIMRKIAKYYEDEADRVAQNLTTMIEPIMIIFLAIGVAILAVGVLSPIYSIATQM